MFYMFLSVIILNVLFEINLVAAVDNLKFWNANSSKLEEARRQLKYNASKPALHLYSHLKGNTTNNKRMGSHSEKTTPMNKVTLDSLRLRAQKKRAFKDHFATRKPVYLRQVEGDAPPSKAAVKDAIPEVIKIPDRINPYALVEQIKEWEQCFPEAIITIDKVGVTAEYNDLILLKISHQKSRFRAVDKFEEDTPEKKTIFIVHGLSSRGLKIYDMDPKSLVRLDTLKMLFGYYFKHLKEFDIMLMPLANPDATVTPYNVWDKNMSPQRHCLGVNLDRNFDVRFNAGHKISSCSQFYPGPYAFSEPETRAIRDIFNKYGHKIIAYLHVHYGTYSPDTVKGEAILYPRGFSETNADDDKYIDLRGEVEDALKNASFQYLPVTIDSLYNWYGNVTGTSVDYASVIFGVPFAMELVMQQYSDEFITEIDDEKLGHVALKEVWKTLIDVIFNNIYQYIQNSNSRRLNLFGKI